MTRVSVIIPTFNRFQLLCRAVESVLSQTYLGSEIIVVDDGSTDNTEHELVRLYPEVQYTRIEHSGLPAAARNIGLQNAKGDYVAFLDSDDQWLPEKLERQIPLFDINSSVGLICSNAAILEGVEDKPKRLYLQPEQGKSGRVLAELSGENFVITSTAIVRRSILSKVGVFSEDPLLRGIEDYDLWLRIAATSDILYIRDPLALYRNEPSASIRGEQAHSMYWQGRLLILEHLQRFLDMEKSVTSLPKEVFVRRAVSCQWALCKALWNEGRRSEGAICALRLIYRHPIYAETAVLGKARRFVKNRLRKHARRMVSPGVGDASSDGLRLHLGCGEVYLPGYVNIDFPIAQHTVQQTSKADVHADVTQLSYPSETVDEVRLHHVFEHFDRVTALRLLKEWYRWLKEGGRLVVETPDFDRCVKEFVRSRPMDAKFKLIRHLFGSQEAPWAAHYDAWYREKFESVLPSLGYCDLRFSFGEWRGAYSITVTAKKIAPFKEPQEQIRAIEALLRLSLMDDSASEERMLNVWLAQLSHLGNTPGRQ